MKDHPRRSCFDLTAGPISAGWKGRWKTALLSLAFAILFVWQWATRYRFVRTGFVRFNNLIAPLLMSDLSEGQLFHRLEGMGMNLPAGGCVWDIGANDGVWNSNSFYLINYLNYTATLFEPDAEVFLSLRKRYAAASSAFRGRVELFNCGLVEATKLMEYRVFPASLESTLVKDKKRQFDPKPDFIYHIAAVDARLVCEQQREYVRQGRCGRQPFTVLSIDAEGYDRAIFGRVQQQGCTFDVVIIEADRDIVEPMRGMGYKVLLRNAYNIVFTPDRKSVV